jgi:hypothetical protein
VTEPISRPTARPRGRPVRQRGGWRSVAAALLCVLAGLLAGAAVLGVWARGQVLDTDRYLASVGPLAQSPALQDDVARLVSGTITQQVDSAIAQSTLTLTPAERAAVDRVVEGAAAEFTQSPAFAQQWLALNRAGHTTLVRLLAGDDRPAPGVSIVDGRVQVDLTPAVEAVRAQMGVVEPAVVSVLPPITLVVDVADVAGLERARTAVGRLERLGQVAPYLAVAVGYLAVAVASRRLRTIVLLAVCVGLAMGVLWLALGMLRTRAISELNAGGIAAGVSPIVVERLTSLLSAEIRWVAAGAAAVGAVALIADRVRAGRERRMTHGELSH